MMLKLIDWVQNLLKKIRKDRLAAYSGQSAYFIILSFLPFLLFLLTLVQHLPIDMENLMDAIFLVIPRSYETTVAAILNDIHVESGATILSVSVIRTIWTAGKGIMALSDGPVSYTHLDVYKRQVFTLSFDFFKSYTIFYYIESGD